MGEEDKQGQVCVLLSQLRCQLELPGEGRPAWFTSVIRKNIDLQGISAERSPALSQQSFMG